MTMEASLVISVCSLGLACASLSWQAANYTLTGGRIRVTLQLGATGPGGMVTAPPAQMNPEQMKRLGEQGFPQPIVAVKVANVGRQPVTVQRWGLATAAGPSLHPLAESIGKPLPHRLEVGQAETWAVDFVTALRFAQTTREVFGHKQQERRSLFLPPADPTRITAIAELADGRTKHSREALT